MNLLRPKTQYAGTLISGKVLRLIAQAIAPCEVLVLIIALIELIKPRTWKRAIVILSIFIFSFFFMWSRH